MKGEGCEIRNRDDVFGRRAAPPRASSRCLGYFRTRNCAHQRAQATTTMTTRTQARNVHRPIRGWRRRRRRTIEMDTQKALPLRCCSRLLILGQPSFSSRLSRTIKINKYSGQVFSVVVESRFHTKLQC